LRELNAVSARVPLMPTSQSLSERHTAALASGSSSEPGANGRKPSRIDAGVIDWSQSRSIGFCSRQLHDVAENQFALAARVARIDQAKRRYAGKRCRLL
jgi:hypothetical protein